VAPGIPALSRNKEPSSVRRSVSLSTLPETQEVRYQLRLVFQHASKHESKRFQAIQGSEIIILEPSTLEQVICGEYDRWTKFLKCHVLSRSWLLQEFVKLIPYDQSKEVNRNIPIYIKLFLYSIFH